MPLIDSLPPALGWGLAGAVLVANLWGFAQMGWDKRLARLDRRRLTEARLRAPIWAGGAPGIWFGMRTFRHKSAKPSFQRAFWLQTVLFLALAGAAAWVLLR